MTNAPLYILNGPNLNLLGTREPEVYGSDTLADIEAMCAAKASELGYGIEFRQTNSEGELITWIQESGQKGAGLILNAAAYTHTSIGLFDAIVGVQVPTIEVHLSNPHARESFRHHSYVSPAAAGVICGLGAKGYVLAIEALAEKLSK